jgi:pyrimidine operon attenuation protein/uracil phosphoribosyltransferase
MKTTVLNQHQIQQKINRIAYEILENNYESEKLFLIGIKGNGC